MTNEGTKRRRFWPLTALWAGGAATLALATWVSFVLGLNSATAACVYLVIIVALSLVDSFATAVLFPVIAVLCLDYFFIEPLFELFVVSSRQDIVTLSAFLVTSLVITTLVRRLRRLGRTLSEQARLLELTHDAVLVRDPKGVIKFWNRRGEELYGWKKEEALGTAASQLLKTQFPDPPERITEELLRSGFWEGELVQVQRDGTRLIVSSRWSVQRDENGQPIGTLEINSDITARKRIEDALRGIQETYLAEAQQLSRTGSFGWKISTGEIFSSEEGFKIFGFDSTIRPSIDLLLTRVHPDDRASVDQVIERASLDRKDFAIEHRLRLPDGSIKHVRIVARAMADGTSADFVGAVMDITSIRLAEMELQNTRTALAHVMRVTSLGELTASIAHEVNQPLGAVVANAEACLGWLAHESPDLGEARAAVQRIVRDGYRAGEIIRRVRALIEKTETTRSRLDLKEILAEALSVVEPELRRHGVSQRTEVVGSLPIWGDRIQLEQVLLNLILNAIEAMQPIVDRPRELVIRLACEGPRFLQVSVTDCGVGLPVENTERIFDAFVTTKAYGMGMGLSICRSIIQAHGGKIWASPNQPFGAVVQFTLPHGTEPK